MDRNALISALKSYSTSNAIEAEHLHKTLEFVCKNDHCCDRNLSSGHITASSWIIDEHKKHALLTHHRKLNRWLQLGGHIEDDHDILSAALREAREESGLNDIHTITETIFDIDVHLIPARKQNIAHFHYDLRFLFQAQRGDALIISDESHDLRWFSLRELNDKFSNDDSLDRMIKKMAAAC